MTTVSVTILTHNRPELLSLALDSVLSQRAENIHLRVRVSDNSDDERTKTLCAAVHPSVDYVKRALGTSAPDHFRAVIAESSTDFLVMFHDDDVLHSDYVSRMVKYFEKDLSLVAVGCNAKVIDGEGKCIRASWHRHRKPLLLRSAREVFVQYLPGSRGCAPLSSYMFRTSVLSPSMIAPAHAGKYSDVVFIANVAERGSIAWVPDRLMS